MHSLITLVGCAGPPCQAYHDVVFGAAKLDNGTASEPDTGSHKGKLRAGGNNQDLETVYEQPPNDTPALSSAAIKGRPGTTPGEE